MITTEEIDRLMRVVSEPLRFNWELLRLNGNSLLIVKKLREHAIVIQKRYQERRSALISGMFILVGIASVVVLVPETHGPISESVIVTSLILAFLLAILMGIYACRCEKIAQNEIKTIEECEQTFEDLRHSVTILNPLSLANVHHDLVTEGYVRSYLQNLAFRLLDAEIKFDRTCQRSISAVDRQAIMVKGEWIKKCQARFDGTWDAATNHFGLKLDKQKIFRDAATEMTRDELKPHPSS